MTRRAFAVLESRWFQNEISVRPLFDLLCDAKHKRGDYVYERFVSRVSFEEILKFVIGRERISYLYIGSHGVARQLECPNRDRIEAVLLRDLTCRRSNKIFGLFVSACRFLTVKNAEYLLDKRNANSLVWVCGYEGQPDWFTSAVFEILFFSQFFDEPGDDKEAIENVAKRFNWRSNCLSRDLGFNIFIRSPRRASGLINIARS
jgi:hypothetical protein